MEGLRNQRCWSLIKVLKPLIPLAVIAVVGFSPATKAEEEVPHADRRTTVEEAFVYGFPMVMNYAVFHDYFIDKSSP